MYTGQKSSEGPLSPTKAADGTDPKGVEGAYFCWRLMRDERENYDAWLGLIIGEGITGHKTVEWVCSADGGVETVNHTPEELVVINESR